MIFGAHQSISGALCRAIERGQQATCDTVQIFNKSNNQWRAKKLVPKEVDDFFKSIETIGIGVACSHNSYLINLASPNPELEDKSLKSFIVELERCNLLHIPNLVFHPGSHVGSGIEIGLDRIATNLNRTFEEVADNSVTLCLEATAGQGTNLGHRFEELAYIIDRVDNASQIGVCLDTCHIFAAGYPISETEDYLKSMTEFDDIVGFDRLKIVHVNDSKKELGSRVDRHEHIGKGEIGLEGFQNFVNDARFREVPMVIETPKEDDLTEDIENLKVLRSLVTD